MSYFDTALYVDSVQYTAVSVWTATHAYTVGNIVRQLTTPTVGQERCFVCIIAGTSLGSEPTWVITRGAKTAEASGPTWQECTGLSATNGDKTSTPNWNAVNGVAVSLGVLIQNVAGTYYFICTTAGTAGSSEPAWTLTAGATTSDNTVTWTCLGAISGFTGTWKAPAARLSTMFGTSWLVVNGTKVYVGDDHAETASAVQAINPTGSANVLVLCVDHTVAVPPGSANLKTTATITDSSASLWNVMGQTGVHFYVYGIQFIKSGNNTMQVASCSGTVRGRFENCVFSLTTASIVFIEPGYQATGGMTLEFIGCTFHLGGASQGLSFCGSTVTLKNCVMTGTNPTAGGITSNNGGGSPVLIEGCDLSNWTSFLFQVSAPTGYFCLKDCKLASGVGICNTTGLPVVVTIDLNRCDNGGTNYRNERHSGFADQTTSTSIVRTGGASDGTTAISYEIVTSTNLGAAMFISPITGRFDALPLVIWNSVIGTNRAVTVYGLVNDTRVPNNDEVWAEVEYLGSASSPQGSFASNFKANVLATGSPLTVDTSTWDSLATARANSTAYVVGSIVKVSNAPGQIFFCTAIVSTGISAASPPAGYATCADGSSVTDGNCTFRAGCRFSMTLTLSAPQPAQVGYLYAYTKFARTSSTYFIDPEIYLS